jgi:hypothetical protein
MEVCVCTYYSGAHTDKAPCSCVTKSSALSSLAARRATRSASRNAEKLSPCICLVASRN